MTTTPFLRRRALLGSALAAVPLSRVAAADNSPVEHVATFTQPHQVTGVAVSPTGRVFVNFPRWEEDVAISVAEIGRDGTITPYPDAAWNSFRNTAPTEPGQRFVCVQALACDPHGDLWVVDPAAPGLTLEVKGGPKLVQIDLAQNKVKRVLAFDENVAPQGSYLNDIRFTPDGTRAVMTNSGQPGCLITLDVTSGAARRVLDGHPSTQFEKGLVVTIEGKPLVKPDGQTAQFSADGIAIDAAGEYVYWQATTGRTMYRAPIKALFDPQMSAEHLAATVELYTHTFIADGYLTGRDGAIYVTSCADSSVKRMLPDRSFAVVAQDPRLVWPDSMAQGPDGFIYVTASHIPEMKAWQGPGVQQTQLFRFKA